MIIQTTKNETLSKCPNDPVERAVQKMLKAEKEYINILTVMEEKMFGHLSKILTSKEQTIIFYGIKVNYTNRFTQKRAPWILTESFVTIGVKSNSPTNSARIDQLYGKSRE